MGHLVLFAWCVLASLLLSVSIDAAKFAPNHFLGKCLTDQWVKDVETKLKVSSTSRDEQLRLLEPHLHAALPSRRFAVRDPRTNIPRDQLFSKACTKTPFRFWGVGANADPATGDPSTDSGSVNGSLVIELKGWASSQLTTLVFAILAQEVLGYNVSIYRSTNAVDMGARMASTPEGFCTPLHINVEEWGRDHTAFANESFKAGTQSYVGRSGLYTTKKFVEAGLDPAQYTPTFSADFWRDYAANEKLIAALDIAKFKSNAKYYPPSPLVCANGFRGCMDGCSKTDTCTAREKQGKKCLVVPMMFPTYDDGWAESTLANNKVPSYHCFLGDTAVEQFAVEMEAANQPIFFYHYEPDPFHYVHLNKFRRVFLPRTLPELVKLNKGDFGENGYGEKTNNPLSVDFLPTTLSIYAASLLQDHAPIAALLSRFTLDEMDMGTLLQAYVDLDAQKTVGVVQDDAVFSSACAWVRDNYAAWKRWLARLPLCDLDLHIDFTIHHCGEQGRPREIRWAWKEPHPLDALKPYVCDGGRTMLPKTITTSKPCDWLVANKLVWQAWTVQAPVCDAQFFAFKVSSCDARAKREATYAWLLPDPTDATKSLECRQADGGVTLPAPVELACEYTPYASPIAQAVAILSAVLALVLVALVVFVIKYRNEAIVKRSQYEFLTVMLLGGVLMCGAAVVYAGEPTHFLCAARPLVTSLAFTLIFGALVVKSLRVYRVFMSGAMKRVVLSTATMFKILGLFVLVDLLILLAWFVIDFPRPYLQPTKIGALSGATIDRHVCASSSFIFSALLIFWKAIVLFMGLYLSFLIRNVSSDFQESIWIFASSLVVLFGSIILLPMAYLVELPADVFYAFLAFMLLACTTLVMSMMLVPKIRRLHERSNDVTTVSEAHGDDNSYTATTAGNGKRTAKVSRVRLGTKANVAVTPMSEAHTKVNKSISRANEALAPGVANQDSSDEE
jgi:gamma-aminobutyric acid type B receptor